MMFRNPVSPSAFYGSRLLALAVAALLFLPGAGCDTGSRAGQADGIPDDPGQPPRPPGGLRVPILFGITEGDSNLCVGQVITLTGINFSGTLANNRVIFRAGRIGIAATPMAVAFPIDRNPGDGLDSQLKVIIPSGVITGSVELEVSGTFAGAIGFTACPMIYNVSIGPQRDQEILQHNGPLGFDPQLGPDTVVLQGVNFEEVVEVQIEDFQGNRQLITGGNLLRRDIQPANGLDTLLFSLQSITVAVQPNRSRDNLRMRLRGGVTSNQVSVPVQPSTNQGEQIGPIVNGVILPSGVRTGPVRIQYSFYDRPVSMSYNMRFEWSADAGKTWFDAKHRDDDRLSDGTRQVLPGYRAFGNPLPAANLIVGGGALRTFTWDAQNDPNFRSLNNSPSAQGTAAPRNWIIRFRISAAPSFVTRNNDRFDPGILFETPPIAYFDVIDRPGESVASLRRSEFVEDFLTENTKDILTTTALWGPPFNVGSLEGRLQNRPVPLFGTGTFDLRMSNFTSPPPDMCVEFYLIDTLRMRISQVALVNRANCSPVCSVDCLEQLAFPVFPTADVLNPGESLREFHLRTLVIDPNVTVVCEGTRPLVIKLSGRDLAPEEVAFQHDGIIQANGGTGGPAADPCMLPALPNLARGGVGVLGSGNGGDGARMTTGMTAGTPVVTSLVPAQQGGLLGGRGGESPGVLDPEISRPSRFWGAPGGGGGNRLTGGTGDPGSPQPTVFNPPRGGRGGAIRGSEHLNPLIAGSGGGGGGATFARPSQTDPSIIITSSGGGGGGGGGAIRISSNGSMSINGQIQANGGAGGSWVPPSSPPCIPLPPGVPSGPGGGGSGGSILLQSSGFVFVDCANLEVNGGPRGEATAMNREPGSGDGAPGWIRVETRLGGGPFCSILALQTTLAARLSESVSLNLTISVTDVSQFPPTGVLIIDNEVIAYQVRSATNNTITRLTRGLRGTAITAHEIGAAVILEAVVEPPGAIAGGRPQVAAGEFPDLAGLDDVLDVSFIPSLDPETGDFLRDSTGRILSIWTFNTDEGVVRDPRGAVVKVAIDATDRPGVLQLTRLRVGAGVTLRCTGSRPAEFLVVETADIAGSIDASGQNGGMLRFDIEQPSAPEPGLGGLGGPGGGAGGTGGTLVFSDGDIDNRTPANAEPVAARPGGLPPGMPPEWEVGLIRFEDRELADDLAEVRVTRPTAGAPLRDNACENQNNTNNCVNTAGGGGGGGHQAAGQNGESRPANATNGIGGGRMGTDSMSYGGQELLIGGQGGAGGGSSLALSGPYVRKQAGSALFQGEANYGPGTGGGGGGGVIRLAVGGALIIRGTGSLVANGGNAFQSIDLAGNGGAGAGGTILVQAVNSFAVEPGAKMQVRGGIANLRVLPSTGQTLPVYEGNIRFNSATRVDDVFGGRGGNGASGRVRIEVPAGSVVLRGGFNTSVFSGLTLLNTEVSAAFSVPLRLGIGPARTIITHHVEFSAPVLQFREFGQPIGTSAILLWQGAPESIHDFAQVGTFSDGVLLPSLLYDTEHLRFHVVLLSNNVTREIPSIQRLRLPIELKP